VALYQVSYLYLYLFVCILLREGCWVVRVLLLVVLDRRLNSSCDTGQFELIYRATTNPNTRGSDTRFIVGGQRINKVDLQRYATIDRKAMRQQQQQQAVSKDKCEEHDGSSVQCADSASTHHSEPVDYERRSGSTVAVAQSSSTGEQTPPAARAAQSASHERGTATAHSHRPSSNKAYRGLRPSTVQIYNGR